MGVTILTNHRKETIGILLALFGSLISCIGVIANNIMLDHLLAMMIWRFSNVILMAYFFGLYRRWWNGGISAGIMTVLYFIFVVTNEWGINHALGH